MFQNTTPLFYLGGVRIFRNMTPHFLNLGGARIFLDLGCLGMFGGDGTHLGMFGDMLPVGWPHGEPSAQPQTEFSVWLCRNFRHRKNSALGRTEDSLCGHANSWCSCTEGSLFGHTGNSSHGLTENSLHGHA